MISGVIHGVIRPPVRATLSTGEGVRGWMWATGALNVSGVVDNTKAF